MDTTAARAAAVARHGRPLLTHVPSPRAQRDHAPGPDVADHASPGTPVQGLRGRHGHDVVGLLDGTPVRLGAIVAAAAAHLLAPQASSST